MIDKNKVYKTRDGREVRIYATDGGHGKIIHGAIKNGPYWDAFSWQSNGMVSCYGQNVEDLVKVRPHHKRTVWVNVYDSGVSRGFELREWADVHADNDRIACIKVELDFEEGEGL